MQTSFAYFTSAFVHVAALVGLAYYLPQTLGPRLDVESGQTIVASFVIAQPQAEPEAAVVLEPADAEPLPPEVIAPVETELEINPAATQLKRRETTAKDVYILPAVAAEQDETPPPQSAARPPPAKEQPPAEAVTKRAAKKTETSLEIAQHQIAMPHRAAASAGANVDRLPRQFRSNRPPLYPPEEIQAGVTGLVHIRCLIAASGGVDSAFVEASSGSVRLDDALFAVRAWQFEPVRRGGLPVAFEVIVPVRFSIR